MNVCTEVRKTLPETDMLLPRRVCFVCTGNTCRSPMAAAVTNTLGRERGISAVSAGLYPNVGDAISKNALCALLDAGYVPCEGNRFDLHTAQVIGEELISACDMIVAISRSHFMTLICSFPSYAQKITVMPHDISDPFGGDLTRYKTCLEEITAGIKELFGFGTDKGRSL